MKTRLGAARVPSNVSSGTHSVSPARRAAFEILRRVEDEDAFASVLLASLVEEAKPEDRALCYEIVMGVLRWQLWLDASIEHFADRKVERLDNPVRRALRIGLYELRFLSKIPTSASVNEAVNLTYFARVHSAAGFVNAVLRRAAKELEFDPAEKVSDQIERLSISTSHPVWLIERWIKSFGYGHAEYFARANNKQPPTAFRRGPNCADLDNVLKTLRDDGGSIEASSLVPDAWRVNGGNRSVRELALAGQVYLQDEASQLVAHALGVKSGDRVLDVCAAPGSKTTHIASIAPSHGLLVAGDLHLHRLRTVINVNEYVNEKSIDTAVYDATIDLPFSDEQFDRVLVDAPCSGTGTLRHNPEIRWRIRPQDISDLASKQKCILDNSARVVRRGGRLVYSTCSVEMEENEDVIFSFQKDHDEFVPVAIDVWGQSQGKNTTMRTWPHLEGADGFFISAFERKK